MEKRISFIGCLLLGIYCFGMTDFVADEQSAEKKNKVSNVSRGSFLPSTGGAGIIVFLVIGLSLMGIAVVRYRKTQHTA